MNYTTNYNLNKPERNEQFNIDHWNDNSDAIDTQMHVNAVNIATNASDILSIVTNLTTNKANDSSSTFYKLMKLVYPVGSIYWSSNSTNPSMLFGGTWVQIKDRFVLACGNTYSTVGATGGEATHTLTVAEMPAHNHNSSSSTTNGSVSTDVAGSHTHTYFTAHYHSTSTGKPSLNANVTNSYHMSSDCSTNSSGNHSHSITMYARGGGNAHNNMPPYIVKYCWERTA